MARPARALSFPRPLTAPQAAEALGCDATTVRRLIRRGALPAFRVGSDWRIHAADLAAYQEANRATPPVREVPLRGAPALRLPGSPPDLPAHDWTAGRRRG